MGESDRKRSKGDMAHKIAGGRADLERCPGEEFRWGKGFGMREKRMAES